MEEIEALLDNHRGPGLPAVHLARGPVAGAGAPRPARSVPAVRPGEGSKSALLSTFKTTPRAVLLGTSSFWHGVDVPGEALSLVVIDKLPFDVPSDPLVAARIERIRENEGTRSRNTRRRWRFSI